MLFSQIFVLFSSLDKTRRHSFFVLAPLEDFGGKRGMGKLMFDVTVLNSICETSDHLRWANHANLVQDVELMAVTEEETRQADDFLKSLSREP